MSSNISVKINKSDAKVIEQLCLIDIENLNLNKELLPIFKEQFQKIYKKAHTKALFESRPKFAFSFTQSEAASFIYVLKRFGLPVGSYEHNTVRFLISNIDPKL